MISGHKVVRLGCKVFLFLIVTMLYSAVPLVSAQDETKVNLQNKVDSLQRYFSSLTNKDQVDTLLAIGRALVGENDYGYAFAVFDQTIKLSKKYGCPIREGLSYAGIGSVHKERQDSPEECKRYYLEALAIGQRTEDPELLTRAYLGVGSAYGQIGNYDSAMIHIEEAVKPALASGDKLLISQTYLKRGDIYAIKGNYTESLPHYLDALKTAEELGDGESVAIISNSLGIVYYQTGQNDRAIAYWNQALDIFRNLGQEGRIGSILINLGTSHRDQKDYKKALDAYKESLDIAERLGNKTSIVYALISLGDVYSDQKEHKKAQRYYEKSLPLTYELNHEYSRVYALLGLGENQYHFKEYLEARDYFNEGLKLAEHMELLIEQRDGYLMLSSLDSAVEYYDSAYIHYKRHATISQKILDDEKVKQLAEMRAKYEAEEQVAANERLQLINEWQNRRIDYLIIGSVSSLLLLIFILALYLQLKKAHNENRETLQLVEHQKKELAESNATKEQFFSIIAHDLKSPLNSLQGLISVATEHHGDRTNEYVRYFDAINDDIKSITCLLNNLLYWALNQKDQIAFQPEKLDLTALVKENLGLVASLIKQKEIEVVEELDPNVRIKSDKNMISFILRNLLTNAAKFTQAKGQIILDLSVEDDRVVLSIQDNGIGMKEKEVNRLFRSNNRFTKQGTFKERGTGLGLQLSNEFAAKMGVEIEVQSEHNVGTSFTLVFPV